MDSLAPAFTSIIDNDNESYLDENLVLELEIWKYKQNLCCMWT
jgi:hypothetical protein